MTLRVSLWVSLKGTDLVASTAWLTLVDTMGHGRNLLGLCRFDVYEFAVESDDPARSAEEVKRLFAGQGRFYNRNKHNYLLDISWKGGHVIDGMPLAENIRRLAAEVTARIRCEDFDGNKAPDRAMLNSVPVFRTDVLIEDLDPATKERLSRYLESELAATVEVSALGTCWYLALRAGSEGEATEIARNITVTQSRDRGLLLNPNSQGLKILSQQTMDAS
ncbi:MAG: hypothetical protein O7D32_07230 [bacterium]|nr:hypothetical protein [bacterium]